MQILGILSGLKISVDPSRTFPIYLVKNRSYCTSSYYTYTQCHKEPISRPPIVFCVAQHPQSEKRTWRVYRFNNICRLPINSRGYNIVITFYRSRTHPHTNVRTHTHTNKCSHIHTHKYPQTQTTITPTRRMHARTSAFAGSRRNLEFAFRVPSGYV